MWPFKKKPKLTLEQQIETLKECGIEFTEGFSIDEFLDEWGPREDFEKRQEWILLLGSLAFTPDDEGTPRFSSNVYCLDTECVDGDHIYPQIAKDMAFLTDGLLTIDNATSSLDFDGESITVDFTCNGKEIHLEPEFNDDWVDAGFFDVLYRLLAEQTSDTFFVWFDTGGQDALFMCLTMEEVNKLRKLGVKLEIMRG